MPDPPNNPNPPDKPGLELFKGDDALTQLTQRAQQLKHEGFDLEFVLAKYKE